MSDGKKFIYRHKQNQKLYTIEHLILDIKHLNCNAFAGIYASPYIWPGEKHDPHHVEQIVYRSQSSIICEKFVEDNFEKVAELLHY